MWADRKSRYLLAVWLAVAVLASAAVPAKPKAPPAKPKAPPAASSLRRRIAAILAEPDARRAHWGVKVVSLKTGKTLYAHNSQKFFTPASNSKLFTTALALATLGPQFRFYTTVESEVAPDANGRIAGDLWLVGRGDPNISARVLPYKGKTRRKGPPLRALDELAEQVAARGIHHVSGDLVADDTYFVFERYGKGWTYDDLLWSYGAPVSALSVNDNVLAVEVLPGERPGDPAMVKLEPSQDYYRIENRVVTVLARGRRSARRPSVSKAGGDGATRRISVRREPGSYTLKLRGRIPMGGRGAREEVALEDPALFAGKYLHAALRQRGVVVDGQVRVRHAHPSEFEDLKTVGEPPIPVEISSRRVLASHQSHPLVEDLKVVNKVSQNLHAEILLRTVARERRDIGSVAAAMEELKEFLNRAGVPKDEYLFFDGSGLSRRNLVTPTAVVALLQYMDRRRFRDTWLDLLPVAGVDGTLKRRLRNTAATGRVLAKTGMLGHVTVLSGYATTQTTTQKGVRLAFSIMVNNHKVRGRRITRLIDRICLALVRGR